MAGESNPRRLPCTCIDQLGEKKGEKGKKKGMRRRGKKP
jgi:hypothetical protein